MVRHFRLRAVGAAAAVSVTVLAAACSSSSSGNGNGSGPSGTASATSSSNSLTGGQQALNPGTGTPKYGGTLNEIGVSDVEFMDYDVAYYSTDDEVMRLSVRSLYNWGNTQATATTPEPDLATGAPQVSADGKTVTVTIRSGVMWNTTPARAVTAADVVRGIKRACNPSPVSFGGMADFEDTIVGLSAFCAGYPKAAASNAAVMKQYIESHNVSGITANGNTLTFKLTQPAAWLEGAMTLAPFSAVPIEAENALPGTPGVYDHMYSDGPYQITSYIPKKSIKFTRNPVWKASTDPLRKAYVDAINVDETGNQTTIYQEISTNTPDLGMTWDSRPPPAATTDLVNQVKQGSTTVGLYPSGSSNPYLVFNTVSPNNGGALGKANIRQALSYAIDRTQLIKTQGGTQINVIPSQVTVQMDGRLLPGMTLEDTLTELRAVIGDEVELEVPYFDPGQSEADLGLYETLAGILREDDPAGVPIPYMMPAVTDGRFFSRLGIQTYGFLPVRLPADFSFMSTIHAANERIPVEAMQAGASAVYRALQRFGTR